MNQRDHVRIFSTVIMQLKGSVVCLSSVIRLRHQYSSRRVQLRRSVIRRQYMLHCAKFDRAASAESHVARSQESCVSILHVTKPTVSLDDRERLSHTGLFHVLNSDVTSCMFCSYALFRTFRLAVFHGCLTCRLSIQSVQVGCAQPPASTPLESKRQECYHIGSAAL